MRQFARTAEEPPHLSDTRDIRDRAREHLERGAVTEAYRADRDAILQLLYMASGLQAEPAREELLEHSNEELEHADRLAARIVQLNGEPNFDPVGMAERSQAEYIPGDCMLQEDLVAERIAIESYAEMIRYVGAADPTTRRLLEDILAKEEEHAEELASLLAGPRALRSPAARPEPSAAK
ncbi:MAG TPA: ferritin-like domain-containing protein [Steroidobacteraceae bacterium]|jgi:bacterioferritin|nr:ferritin-like domain-containing protein [Steroidobacteraceae bacterium]